MPGSCFDTNVVVYLASTTPVKAARARHLLREGGIISVQVLNETANVARRKLRLPWAETHELLTTLRNLLQVVPVTIDTHSAGLAMAQRYNLSLYDAMIVAAAIGCGCGTLWSEDMQHGLLVEGALRVTNPFAGT